MRIVLCGFRGTGKTECGRLLSKLTGLPFMDVDAMIEERTRMTIHEIFSRDGEKVFREYERQTIASLPVAGCIVSTGGGAVIDPQNVSSLRKESTMILLEADPAAIERRIRNTARPPLTKLPFRDEIRALLSERKPLYSSAADFCINTTTKNPNEVCLTIIHFLSEGSATPGSGARAIHFLQQSGIPVDEVASFEQVINSGDPKTRLFAIAGNPATQSRSPALFNQLFSHFGLNCFYTRFQAPDITTITRICRDLDLRGLSITIPFKKAIMNELSIIDSAANAIGAVNTAVWCGEESFGYNTDWIGIREPLADRKGSRAVVLGAGGAAAAAVYALKSLDMEITILNRTVPNAEALGERFDCRYGPFGLFDRISPDIVVNTTPLGMSPNMKSPLKNEQLRPSMTIFDLVYTPPETPLIRFARNSGCSVIPGTEMFVRQAAAQFKHFTGIAAPLEMVRSMTL